ncbi:carbonic anhydrase [Mycena rebaudengoi]|nr:carbonic anhydrase [Mycena rebaudengoi]
MLAHFSNANQKYAANFNSEVDPAVFRNVVIVHCMDHRIDPYQQLGLKINEAHIIRNAGGLAREALRSIVISQHLREVRDIAIFHHTGCGMTSFTTAGMRDTIKKDDPRNGELAKEADAMKFMEFSDPEESVKEDVQFLRGNPLIVRGTKISGWVYDVHTGKIAKVVDCVRE